MAIIFLRPHPAVLRAYFSVCSRISPGRAQVTIHDIHGTEDLTHISCMRVPYPLYCHSRPKPKTLSMFLYNCDISLKIIEYIVYY